jgi:hypothetical protein
VPMRSRRVTGFMTQNLLQRNEAAQVVRPTAVEYSSIDIGIGAQSGGEGKVRVGHGSVLILLPFAHDHRVCACVGSQPVVRHVTA